jgi:DNA polymerase I
MNKDDSTIYLVDGNSYIHRAFHAIGHLSNSKGFPTNAIYGFTRMLLKLMEDKTPGYLAIVLDAKGPTFRHALYKDYKATRPSMPEDMVMQLPYIWTIIRGLNIKLIERSGYEADDIIGTLARIAEENKRNVVVVTGDKDFRQLLSLQVSLWDTMKDKTTDYRSFLEEYGFEPDLVVDMMGLSGDTSDNVPGVKGVGEKTAAGLIKEYGTLESVFEHLDNIKQKKLKENLEAGHANAILSKKLVAINRHVPIAETIEDLKIGQPKYDELTDVFKELEFMSLWEQFSAGVKETKDRSETEYQLCLTEEEILSLIKRVRDMGIVSMATLTTGSDPHQARLVGLSFSSEESKAWYVPLGHVYIGAPKQQDTLRAVELLKGILEDEKIKKIGHNIKYDVLLLKHHGIDLKGIAFDTMIASYVIDPGLKQHNLDYLASHYLDCKMNTLNGAPGSGDAGVDFSGFEATRAMELACESADITLRLQSVLDARLRKDRNQDLFNNIEMRLLPVLIDMEMTGILIDIPFFKEMSRDFSGRIGAIQKKIFQQAEMEFNINSPQQLGFLLFEKLKLPTQKKTMKTKSFSTDVKVLKKLADSGFEIPGLILQYRTLTKLKSTYLDALVKIVNQSTGRIHTSFNQTVAATGRLSSSNPNMQNIPIRGEEGREIRKGFVAEAGQVLMSADYSQVELRLFAHLSGDKALIDSFERGEDIHARTASEILGIPLQDIMIDHRRIAKAINFGIIYGMGYRKLSDQLGIDEKTAKNYIDSYYNRYTGVTRYRENMINMAVRDGYVTTLFNRRRYIPEIRSENMRIRAEAERIAVNTPIQGTAADLIKMAMISIHAGLKKEGFKTKMLLQVHDELLFEVPEEEITKVMPFVKKEMEEVYTMDVPLKVDINYGKNWDEAH